MNTPLLLNVGSGQRPFVKPWINCDKQAVYSPDLIWDAGNPLDPCPFESDSADCIVLHHVLEHFGCNEAGSLLSECYRLLKVSCPLLVFVPDMWELASMWREGKLSDQLYFTNVYGAYMGCEADRHRWGFTSDSLRTTLRGSQFRRVTMFDWRDVYGADLARDRWIRAVEAYK